MKRSRRRSAILKERRATYDRPRRRSLTLLKPYRAAQTITPLRNLPNPYKKVRIAPRLSQRLPRPDARLNRARVNPYVASTLERNPAKHAKWECERLGKRKNRPEPRSGSGRSKKQRREFWAGVASRC